MGVLSTSGDSETLADARVFLRSRRTSSVPPGYHGRYLRIDAGLGRARCVPAGSARCLRQFLGGVGLGSWILAHETTAGVEPLSPGNALVFALSPLVGSPLTTSAKFAVVAFSPLTGRICDALSSSHFALAAKRAGVDAIAITGACDEPSILFIDGAGRRRSPPRLLPSRRPPLGPAGARGRGARSAPTYGADWQVAAIGPAGERLIPFATISHDGRHAGRGGLGAVLGAKRIKAIAVRGDRRTRLADPRGDRRAGDAALRPLVRAGDREIPRARHGREPARRSTGSHALPTRNFQSGRFEGAERLAAEDLGPARRIARNSCAGVHDRLRAHLRGRLGPTGVRLEYESLFALGPLCGVDDPDAVLRAARACDDAGLDTISTGATIAFLMECTERGLIDGRLERSGRALAFGDGDLVHRGDRRAARPAGHARRAPGPGQPSGRRADRRRGARPGPARQGPGAAGLRPAGPAHDGPRPGRRHPGSRSQPLGGV